VTEATVLGVPWSGELLSAGALGLVAQFPAPLKDKKTPGSGVAGDTPITVA
jgi:hypothetical protein